MIIIPTIIQKPPKGQWQKQLVMIPDTQMTSRQSTTIKKCKAIPLQVWTGP
jgi:hypothetical protein